MVTSIADQKPSALCAYERVLPSAKPYTQTFRNHIGQFGRASVALWYAAWLAIPQCNPPVHGFVCNCSGDQFNVHAFQETNFFDCSSVNEIVVVVGGIVGGPVVIGSANVMHLQR